MRYGFLYVIIPLPRFCITPKFERKDNEDCVHYFYHMIVERSDYDDRK